MDRNYMMKMEEGKEMKIGEYVESLGYWGVKEEGKWVWYKWGLGEEREGWLKVKREGKVWLDYGVGRGGKMMGVGGVV